MRTQPDNGAVLQAAPTSVRLTFDDSIRSANGNEVVNNKTRASALAGKPRVSGRELVLPLRRDLADGDYSVRWSIVSQDGHREQGVLAFGVGAGRAPPQPVLGASTPLAWNTVVLRTLYLLGLLVGVGVVGFWLLARGILGDEAATADRAPPLLRDAGGVPRRERHRPRRGLGHALRARAPHRRHAVARRPAPPPRSRPCTRACSASRPRSRPC